MKKATWLCGALLALAAGAAGAQALRTHSGTAEYYKNRGSKQRMVDLNAYRNHRLLLVFAPSETDSRLVQQLAKVKAAQSGFDTRDMLLFVVTETGPSRAGATALTAVSPTTSSSILNSNAACFKRFSWARIGGIKRRASHVVPMQELFALIDTMPMRRSELRAQQNALPITRHGAGQNAPREVTTPSPFLSFLMSVFAGFRQARFAAPASFSPCPSEPELERNGRL